jgi:diguanylate cyclase (GGDEF)-like protein
MWNTNATDDRPRILAIDDERLNLNVLHGLLKDECKVMVAVDGDQGIKAAQTHLPDLILLDITMPGKNGYEVCRTLREHPATQNIPIIFITALSDGEDETRGLELGAADYITKPFNPSVVRARVKTQLRLKRQNDLLERLAFMDGLTGIANRRLLDMTLDKEWLRGQRSGAPLSALLLDVDHFKKYNDHYGHAQGDECLKQVGQVLSGQARRASDLVARYGGEEFCLLLPDTASDQAQARAQAVVEAFAALALPHAKSDTCPHVTASIGVATCWPQAGAESAQLLQMADQALYEAKRTGRNRMCCAA